MELIEINYSGSGVHGSGFTVQGSGVHGSGVQGSGVHGSGVHGSGVQGSGVQGSGFTVRMEIKRFEDIETWQLARVLTRKVYRLTKKLEFAKDYGLKRQMQDAAGSSMHNIAEGFDSETNAEFIRFLRYAKRSCTEVQSELYVALVEEYISPKEFEDVYEQARRTRAAVWGFRGGADVLSGPDSRRCTKPLNKE